MGEIKVTIYERVKLDNKWTRVSGANFITSVRSGSAGSPGNLYFAALAEIQSNIGSLSFDACGASNDGNASSATHTIPPMTLSGTNDAILQIYAGPNGPPFITAPYYNQNTIAHEMASVGLGITSYSAPTYTTASTAGAAASGMGFKH